MLDRIGDYVETSTYNKINELVSHFNDAASVITESKNKIDKAIDEKTSMFTDSKPSGANVAKTDELSSEDSQPKVTFDGAGSASINLGKRETQATFINLNTSNLTDLDVGASDKNFTGAWSGAGALNFRGADSGKTSVALTGAVAVNNVDSNVLSDISANQNLTGTLNNKAEKSGALIAAGLGLTVSQASAKTSGNYTGAASASVNLSDNVVKAVLKDNTAENLSSINNDAKNVDTQVTGGVNVSVSVGGKKGVAGGGAGVWSDISNDVNALIDGGTYKTSGAVNNNVTTTLTDIAGGVGVSVAQGSESSYGFQGVFTFNKIKNNSHANISNANITAQTLSNSSSDGSGVKAYDKVLTDAGLDVNGDSYSEFAKVGDTDSTQKSIENQTEGGQGVQADESVGYDTKDYGNKIVTAALAVAGAGDGAAQASLAISDVDNDFKSEVTGSNLNIQNDVNIDAVSNTLNINASAAQFPGKSTIMKLSRVSTAATRKKL